jgi:hypothetical protein
MLILGHPVFYTFSYHYMAHRLKLLKIITNYRVFT